MLVPRTFPAFFEAGSYRHAAYNTDVIFCHMLVFDSSTLILIAKIEIMDLFLEDVGMEVAIPAAVEAECWGGKKTLDALMIRKALDESRIIVRKVRSRKVIAQMEEDFNLGRGESEAIALALQERARLVGIDDKNGINACKLAGIPFTTAVGIVVRSRQKGLVDLNNALMKLSALARWGRYRDSIIEEAKLRLEQQP